jgi:hypothetical protein
MHHCRFENTLRDLEVCKQSILEDEGGLSSYEEAAKSKLIKVCLEIVSDVYPELADSEDNPLNYSDDKSFSYLDERNYDLMSEELQ